MSIFLDIKYNSTVMELSKEHTTIRNTEKRHTFNILLHRQLSISGDNHQLKLIFNLLYHRLSDTWITLKHKSKLLALNKDYYHLTKIYNFHNCYAF